MSTMFATLALVCFAFVIVTVALLLTAQVADAAGDAWHWYRARVDGVAMQLAFVIAVVALLGSLYYSEIVDLVPCEYCWFQRIGIYPLSVIFFVALVLEDRGVRKYVVPLCGITALISIWHILVQRVPSLAGSSSCSVDAPCAAILVERFGFVSIPVMALAVTLSIGTLMLVMHGADYEPENP